MIREKNMLSAGLQIFLDASSVYRVELCYAVSRPDYDFFFPIFFFFFDHHLAFLQFMSFSNVCAEACPNALGRCLTVIDLAPSRCRHFSLCLLRTTMYFAPSDLLRILFFHHRLPVNK